VDLAVYPWLDVETEDRLWDELEQREQRRQATARSVTFGQAQNAAGLADAYPWLDPGVVQSLTLAGQGPGSQTARLVAETAGRFGVEDGTFDEPAPNVPDNQFDSLWDGISTNVGRGLLNLSRGAIAVLSAPFEEAFERVAPAIFAAEQETDPLFRGDLGEGAVAGALEAPGNIAASLSKLLQGDFWDSFFTNLTENAAPSTLALAIGDIADPNRSPELFGYDKERGQGLLANFERRQQYRNRITIPGITPTAEDPWANTATVGRVVARQVTEPGTEPYKFLSGLTDFGINLAPVDLGLGKVAKGAGLISRADVIAAGGRVGLLPGIKKAVNLDDAVDGFLTSRVGRRMVDWFTDETDITRIWERTGKNLETAWQLANSTTPDETAAIFRNVLGTTLREVPTAGPVGRTAGRVTGTLAGGRAGLDYGSVFGTGAVVQRSLSNVRFTHELPTRAINPHNLDDAAVQVHDLIRTAKLGDDRVSHYLNRLAELESGDAPGLYREIIREGGLYDEVFYSLLSSGPNPLGLSRGRTIREARKLTRAWSDDIAESRAFFIDAAGRNAELAPAVNIIDGVVHDAKPVAHLLAERLANAIPLPDVQGIKRAANFYNRVWDIPGVTDSVALADFMLGTTWKSLQLVTRLAYPVRVIGEEQVRLAGVGFSSMFRHPIDYLSWAVGSPNNGRLARLLKRGVDEQGVKSAMGDLFTEMDDFKSAMSRGSGGWAGASGYTYTGKFPRIGKDHDRYFDGAATELQQLAADPVAQRIAGGLRQGDARSIGMSLDDPNANTVDAIKEWFYQGTGQKFRKELSEDPNWQRLRTGTDTTTARFESDAYIDSVVERLNIKTGQHPDLLDAVGSGKLGDVPLLRMGGERKIAQALEAYVDSLPARVKVEDIVADGSRVQQAVAVWNKTVDRMFNMLMSVPTNALSRSPHFRQAYWNRMEELLGYADRPTQEALIRSAAELGNLSRDRQVEMARIVNRMTGTKIQSLEEADNIARAFALEATRDTLYDLTRRNQFFDSFRLIFPFGEAWKEIFTAWTRIVGNKPSMLRRFQQSIQGGLGPGFGELASEYLGTGTLPGQGFFHENDHGDLVFNYPGSVLASRFLLEEGGVLKRFGAMFDSTEPARMVFTGELAGLNLMSATILPGLGPTVQVPAAVFTEVFNYDLPDAIENIVFPFGKPPVTEGIGTTLADVYLPAWLDKWETAMADPDSHRLLGNTVMDVMRALVSSGEYSTDSQEEIDRLYDAAVDRAKLLFWIRGAAQSTAPTGPGVQWTTQDLQGNLVPLQWMVDEFHRLADEYGDYDRAADEWLRRFGTDNLLALQGKTRELVPRPLDSEGAGWVEAHPELEKRYGLTVGFYAPDPTSGEFDYSAYLETINEGTRQALTPREMVALSNQFKGRLAYEHLKSQVEGRTDAQAALWLADAKQRLAEEYPGYDGYIPLKDAPATEDFIAEFERAIQDPELQGVPAVEGIRLYMEARTAAQAVVDENSARLNNSRGFTSSDSTRFLREWLRAAAEEITGQHPEFGAVWRHVFQRELADD
jgi:hypothetical protein